MKKSTLIAFGPVLRHFRNAKNVRQDTLGEAVGASGAFISMLESGQRYPSLDMVFKLAEALGVKPSHMIRAMEQRLK